MARPEHLGRTRLDAWGASAVLPADGATVGTSLTGGLILVAHTGKAHLGIPVSRGLLRALARAQTAALRGLPGSDIDLMKTRGDPPDVIPFRHATSYKVGVTDGEIHLTLRAAGERSKPDVHVELKMARSLLERLARHRKRHDRMVLALAAFLALPVVLVILAGMV